jgi:hypothetical protein
MDTDRFDSLTRTFATVLSRRAIAGALGLGALALPDLAGAKKKRKNQSKKKVKFNDFGCVNVGGFCKKAGQCCSGICKGKKGKKKCKAHDGSTCVAGQTIVACGGALVVCTTSGGGFGSCLTTTGNAPYCSVSFDCFPCKKDIDCEPICGQGAACLACGEVCAAVGGTMCAASGGLGCDFA